MFSATQATPKNLLVENEPNINVKPSPDNDDIQSNSKKKEEEEEDPHLNYKCWIVYFMMFANVFSYAPLYNNFATYFEYEVDGFPTELTQFANRTTYGSKQTLGGNQKWISQDWAAAKGDPESILALIKQVFFIIISFEFFQPLITLYYPTLIPTQFNVSCGLTVVAFSSYIIIDKFVESHCIIWFSIAGFIGSQASYQHLIEFYIRQISDDTKIQTQIIERCQVANIVAIVVCLVGTGIAWDKGSQWNRNGMAGVCILPIICGILNFVAHAEYHKYVDFDPSKIVDAAEEKTSKPEYFPASIYLIFFIRFAANFNQVILNIIFVPFMASEYLCGFTFINGCMVAPGVFTAIFYIFYISRDTVHLKAHYHWPFAEITGSIGLAIQLVMIVYLDGFYSAVVNGICCIGFLFGVQAKLVIDRNYMSTNTLLRKTATIAFLINSAGNMTGSYVGPALDSRYGIKCVLVNAAIFLVLGIILIIWQLFRSEKITEKLQTEYADHKFQRESMNLIHDHVLQNGRVSEVAKERLHAEAKKARYSQ